MFLFVLAAIYWLHRSQERFGGGQDVARDPVCGMQVDKHTPARFCGQAGTRPTSALSTAGITTPIPAACSPPAPAKDMTMPESIDQDGRGRGATRATRPPTTSA